jgi:2-aminophenol/2-amino-5-chlorophenol 1,6-dioxygenase alpha subunit
MGDFPFDFTVDTELGARAAEIAAAQGLATKTVSYEGFPIDTGTLVTLHFLNPSSTIPVSLVSCNIYAGREDSLTLGRALGQAIRESGRRAVLIACTALSARFFAADIRPSEDHFVRAEDDLWNRRILDLVRQGKNNEVVEIGPRYAEAAAVDMTFKAFYWLMGALGVPPVAGEVLAYGPLWGTGAAIVEYDLTLSV